MNISSLCGRGVVGIPAEANLQQAAAVMCDEHVASLVVRRSGIGREKFERKVITGVRPAFPVFGTAMQ